MFTAPDPADCQTMTEVRDGVDEVDRRVVELLARRFAYMDAAARIKPSRDVVRDEARKAEVKAKVDAEAMRLDLDRALCDRLYEDLIETSIAHELKRWETLHGG